LIFLYYNIFIDRWYDNNYNININDDYYQHIFGGIELS